MDANEVRSLERAIREKEEVIERQEQQIRSLQGALATDQATIRRLEALASDQAITKATLAQRQQIIETNCDHLERSLAGRSGWQGSNLTGEMQALRQSEQQYTDLDSIARTAQLELDQFTRRDAGIADQFDKLTNQRVVLETGNAEMRSYRMEADNLTKQLELFRIQVHQLETLHLRTQETMATKDAQMIQLRLENSTLNENLRRKRAANRDLQDQVASMRAKLRRYAGARESLADAKRQVAHKERELKQVKAKANDEKIRERREHFDTVCQLRGELAATRNELVDREDKFIENGRLKRDLRVKRRECSDLKHNANAVMEEAWSAKVLAARTEDDLEVAEDRLDRIARQRDVARTRLARSEGLLNACCDRMGDAEEETRTLRNHVVAINQNQQQMATVQREGFRLRKRMDVLEGDVEAYTERQKRNVVRKKGIRMNQGF